MAEPTQFTFSMIETTEALIKHQGLHEGKWILGLEFGVNIAMMGTNPNDVRPGAMIVANNLQLQKAVEPGSPLHLIVDASVVNPVEAKGRKK